MYSDLAEVDDEVDTQPDHDDLETQPESDDDVNPGFETQPENADSQPGFDDGTQPAEVDIDTHPNKIDSEAEMDVIKFEETIIVAESDPLDGQESPLLPADEPDQLPLTPLPINPSLDRSQKQAQNASTAAKRSGLNGFRMFAKQYRLDHADECKQVVSAVSKIIGAAWKALSDDERAEWNRLAAEQALSDPPGAKQSKAKEFDSQKLGSHLQMSRVKGIMQLDKDVHHISKEAVEFVRASAELFIGFMCKTAGQYCGSRHSIQHVDFRQMIKTEPKLKFLLGAFNKNNTQAQTASLRTPAGKRGRNSITDASVQPPAKASKITSFFQKAPAA